MPPPSHLASVDWPALRAALAGQRWQAAYGAAGLARDTADYRAARDEIEAAKAEALATLTQAWRERNAG